MTHTTTSIEKLYTRDRDYRNVCATYELQLMRGSSNVSDPRYYKVHMAYIMLISVVDTDTQEDITRYFAPGTSITEYLMTNIKLHEGLL
jgi:hypothetical protein